MLDLFHFDAFAEDPTEIAPKPVNSGPVKRKHSVANPMHPIHIQPRQDSKRGDLSRMSRMSHVAKLMSANAEAYDLFDETAAILEYDQGMSRQEAEYEAMRRVLASYDETSGSFSAR